MVNDPARFDEKGGMGTYVAPGDHREKARRLRLVSGAAKLHAARHSEPAPRETDVWAWLRVVLAVTVLLSLGLWALLWYGLTRLISSWL
jgi:hypothetical protein